MKTSVLIGLLQMADPTGEEQVCIQNADVWSVDVEPAYYDGSLNVIDRDADNRPVKGTRMRTGKKVNLTPIYISGGWEYTGFTVEYQTEEDRKRYEHIDAATRQQDNEMDLDLDREAFVDWTLSKFQAIRPVTAGWFVRLQKAATEFYDANKMGPDSPFIKIRQGRSYSDCREEYFESAFHVGWDSYSRIVIEKSDGTNLAHSETELDKRLKAIGL